MPKEAVQVFRQALPAPPQIPWATGRFYTSPLFGSITAGQAVGTSLRGIPAYVPNANGVTVTSIGLEITTAGTAGHKMRLGIYTSKDWWPDALLVDSGQLVVDALGFQSAAISKFLEQGWYWLAVVGQSGNCRCASSSTIPRWIGIGDPRESGESTGITALIYSALDDDWSLQGLPGGFTKGPSTGLQYISSAPLIKLGV